MWSGARLLEGLALQPATFRQLRPADTDSLCGEQVPQTRHQAHETLFVWGVGALTGGARRRYECRGLLELVETAERGGVRLSCVEQLVEDFGDRPQRFRGRVT